MFLSRSKVKLCHYGKENKTTEQIISLCFKYRKHFFNLAIPRKNHIIDVLIIVLMVSISMEKFQFILY